MSLLLGGCPRCGGTLYRDLDGWACLACGAALAPDFPLPTTEPKPTRPYLRHTDYAPEKATTAAQAPPRPSRRRGAG